MADIKLRYHLMEQIFFPQNSCHFVPELRVFESPAPSFELSYICAVTSLVKFLKDVLLGPREMSVRAVALQLVGNLFEPGRRGGTGGEERGLVVFLHRRLFLL